MNLICITESELAQWVSRKYFDTLSARLITEQESVTRDIFSTSPYLKLDDARGRIVVSLKEDWKHKSQQISTIRNIEVISIPLEVIFEIFPTMEQYVKRLEIYKLPIAKLSIEKIWDEWLINQAVSELHRAVVTEINKIGCVNKETISNEKLIKAIIEKSLRPNIVSGNESVLMGWEKVFEQRDDWIQTLRVKGHLNSTKMLESSIEIINDNINKNSLDCNIRVNDEERGWEFQDISTEMLQNFAKYDSANTELESFKAPPLFCIAVYLRLYDEIHNGNKEWRIIFNLLRFTKYAVNSLHADILSVALIGSLKTEEIYSLNLRDLYML